MPRAACRAFLVDLGKVLVGFDHGITLVRVEAKTGIPAEVSRPILFGELEKELDTGRLRAPEFFREAERQLGLPPLPDTFWIPAWRDIFEPVPEALATLSRLGPGLRKVLVSNTNELHWQGVQRVSDVALRVDALALSFRVGATKPDVRMWEAALSAAGVPAREAVYADDRPELVASARDIGMDAFLVEGPDSLGRELEARGLLATGLQSKRRPR